MGSGPSKIEASIGRSSAAVSEPELDPPLDILEPLALTSGVVLSSPHSGSIYPERFLASTRLDATSLRRSEDAFVDELFLASVGLGCPMLRARFPRAYLDVNREPYELDPRMFEGRLPSYANTRSVRVAGGLGTIARIVGDANEIYARRLPVEDALRRIDELHKPYHAALRALTDRAVHRFGLTLLIDCHSMPSASHGPPAGNPPAGGPPAGNQPLGNPPLCGSQPTEGPAAAVPVQHDGVHGAGALWRDERTKADFVLGDRYGTSCDKSFADAAEYELRRCGYQVERNKPYAGGYITEHYGHPAQGRHALQIEINRALYMDERGMRKTANFEEVGRHLTDVVTALAALADGGLSSERYAAE